jgi:hypothetical protein
VVTLMVLVTVGVTALTTVAAWKLAPVGEAEDPDRPPRRYWKFCWPQTGKVSPQAEPPSDVAVSPVQVDG